MQLTPSWATNWSRLSFREILEILLVAEVILMLGTGFLILSLRKILDSLGAWQSRRQSIVDNAISSAIEGKPFPKLPRFCRQASVLVPAIERFDKKADGPRWTSLRPKLINDLVRPQIRRLCSSSNWTNRSLAVRSLSLLATTEDETLILKLLKDPTPMVRLMAAGPAAELSTPSIVNGMIDQMMNEGRFARNAYKAALSRAPKRMHDIIRDRLCRETDPFAKRICLDLLAEFADKRDLLLLLGLLKAQHKELRLAALRGLGNIDAPRASDAIEQSFESPQWEMRAQAAKLLGKRGWSQAIWKLAGGLEDSSWWVRMNSALALKEIGAPGLAVLISLTTHQDRFARETAEYVLTLAEIDLLEFEREEKELEEVELSVISRVG